jgi:hypothetical protein
MSAVPASGCLQLCSRILDLLRTSKYNKKECRSLESLVGIIKTFLASLPPDGLSLEGNRVLGGCRDSTG